MLFHTICTKNKEYFFGKIANKKTQLSQIGKIVSDEWVKTEQIRNNVCIGTWVVMPNHIHGIIVIDGNIKTHNDTDACNASLRGYKNKFGAQYNNLSSMIRGFKSTTTKQIRSLGNYNFAWQPRFYDHIIRNERNLNRIREYIINNPAKWDMDEYNTTKYK